MSTTSHAVASYNPRTGSSTPAPYDSTDSDVEAVVGAAAAVAGEVSTATPATRAGWLNSIATSLEAAVDRLTALADEETALGLPRLRNELASAVSALRFYGSVTTDGAWLDVVIDHASDKHPDLRRMNVALGPVAVFGASNFPFTFSVVGHDMATAIAVGCPVVMKAHPAHPRLSEELAALVRTALAQAGAPRGAFGVVYGLEAGSSLVRHSAITAVAFTGSQRGGLALWRLAASRDRVIPVFAEMGTVNTIVVTSSAAAQRASQIATEFVGSFTLGMGQYCTKPGLLLVPRESDLPQRVAKALETTPQAGWLLTEQIAQSYVSGLERLKEAGAKQIAQSTSPNAGWAASPVVLQVDAAALQADSPLLRECFGPVALVVEYNSSTDLDSALATLPGSLAAGVQGADADDPDVAPLVAKLARTAGRVVVNDWPPGAAVTWAQHHGGPWPATTVPSKTSVGAAALGRFTRPVAFQGVPDTALPEALREANPLHVPRRVDGRLER